MTAASPATEPLLRTEALCRHYRRGAETVRALDGVDLTVARGERLCIVGRSGSGKSTLLHLLGGLDTPTSGRIFHDGVETSRLGEAAQVRLRRERIGFVFQAFHLVPWLSAWENVALPLRYSGVATAQRRARAEAALDQVGLATRCSFRPEELSGGEAQRVCVARAIVADAPLLLCDEPTGELDRATADQLIDLLFRLNAERGHTLVMVTHDAELAARTPRTLHLSDGRLA